MHRIVYHTSFKLGRNQLSTKIAKVPRDCKEEATTRRVQKGIRVKVNTKTPSTRINSMSSFASRLSLGPSPFTVANTNNRKHFLSTRSQRSSQRKMAYSNSTCDAAAPRRSVSGVSASRRKRALPNGVSSSSVQLADGHCTPSPSPSIAYTQTPTLSSSNLYFVKSPFPSSSSFLSSSSPSALAYISSLLSRIREFGVSEYRLQQQYLTNTMALSQHHSSTTTITTSTALNGGLKKNEIERQTDEPNRTHVNSRHSSAAEYVQNLPNSKAAFDRNQSSPKSHSREVEEEEKLVRNSEGGNTSATQTHMPTASSTMSALFNANAHELAWATYRLALEAGLRTSPLDEARALTSLQHIAERDRYSGHIEWAVRDTQAGEQSSAQRQSEESLKGSLQKLPRSPKNSKRKRVSHGRSRFSGPNTIAMSEKGTSRVREESSPSTKDLLYREEGCEYLIPYLDELPSDSLVSSSGLSKGDPRRRSVQYYEQSQAMLLMLQALYGPMEDHTTKSEGKGSCEKRKTPVWTHPAFSVKIFEPPPSDAYATKIFRDLKEADAAGGAEPVLGILESVLCRDLHQSSYEDTLAAMQILDRGVSPSTRAETEGPTVKTKTTVRGSTALPFHTQGSCFYGQAEKGPIEPAFDLPFLLAMSRQLLELQGALALAQMTEHGSSLSLGARDQARGSSDNVWARIEDMAESGTIARFDDIFVGLCLGLGEKAGNEAFSSELSKRNNASPSLFSSTGDLLAKSYRPQKHAPNRFPTTLPAVLGATERLEMIVWNLLRPDKKASGYAPSRREGSNGDRYGYSYSSRPLVIVDSALILAQPKRVVSLLERGECIITYTTLCRVMEMATGSVGGTRRTRAPNDKAVAFIQSLLRLRTSHVSGGTTGQSENRGGGEERAGAASRELHRALFGSSSPFSSSARTPIRPLSGGLTVLGLQEELLFMSLAVSEFGLSNALAVSADDGFSSLGHHEGPLPLRSRRHEVAASRWRSVFLKKRREGKAQEATSFSLLPRPSREMMADIDASNEQTRSSMSSSNSSRSIASPSIAARERVSIIAAARVINMIIKDRSASSAAEGGENGRKVATTRSGTSAVDDFLAEIGVHLPSTVDQQQSEKRDSLNGGHREREDQEEDPLLHSTQLSVAAREPVLLAMAHQHQLHVLIK